jgi:signal transduction histidine kinase
MRRRMADIGGKCTIESRPGGGTQVQLTLTLPKKGSVL